MRTRSVFLLFALFALAVAAWLDSFRPRVVDDIWSGQPGREAEDVFDPFPGPGRPYEHFID